MTEQSKRNIYIFSFRKEKEQNQKEQTEKQIGLECSQSFTLEYKREREEAFILINLHDTP